MCPLGDHEVAKRGSIPAGGMIAADLKTGKFYDHKEIVDHLAAQAPYEEWLSAVTELDPEIGPGPKNRRCSPRKSCCAARRPLAIRWKR
jgi:glutamate synthase (NADPH/NADH) large chain